MADRLALGTVLRLTLALLVLVGGSYGADWLLRAENFPVQNVRFEGPFKRVTQRDLEAAVLDLVRGNFVLVDLDAVKQRVEALPWVHRAAVRRRFPHDIAIEFSEQRLAARWTEGAWLNTSGEVVRVSGEGLPEDLPQLEGPDGTGPQVLAAYGDFRAALEPLDLRLIGVQLAARRSWRLEVAGSGDRRLTLVLEHQQPRARLERFARVYPVMLAGQAGAIRQVDLRYTNGFAVQWRHTGGRPHVARAAAARNEG